MKHYILKVLPENLKAYNGFQWPSEIGSVVTAPDWNPIRECGRGLHGWLNGIGNTDACNHFSPTAKWLILSTESFVNLDGKVKFESCIIEYLGDQQGASEFLQQNLDVFVGPIIGKILVENSQLNDIGGDWSILTGGDNSTLTGWNRSTLTGGYRSTLMGGDYSTLTAGCKSTLTAGYKSTLTGGYYSTLTGGRYSILTGGDYSTLTGGHGSTLTGGHGSELRCQYYDRIRFRTAVAYVGENGIEPNVPYKVNSKGDFVKFNSLIVDFV